MRKVGGKLELVMDPEDDTIIIPKQTFVPVKEKNKLSRSSKKIKKSRGPYQ
jgi:hypothetical protein